MSHFLQEKTGKGNNIYECVKLSRHCAECLHKLSFYLSPSMEKIIFLNSSSKDTFESKHSSMRIGWRGIDIKKNQNVRVWNKLLSHSRYVCIKSVNITY